MFFFRRITAKPSECLIIIKDGKMQNMGNGASVVVYPWDSFVFVPTTTMEYCFQMHQESVDGITLRFKGIVIYRITDVELAASLFDFIPGRDPIARALGDICLGELRAIVAAMTMDQCINERKTTLTEHLKEAVIPIVEGHGDKKGWGIKVDVLQVAQVFCPDEKLLAQLQAEARDKIRKTAQFSEIETSKSVTIAQMDSELEMASQTLQLEKDRLEKKRELDDKRITADNSIKIAELEKSREYEEKKIAADAALKISELESRKLSEEKKITIESELKLFEIEKQKEIARQELELRELQSKVNEITLNDEVHKEKILMEIKKEILPLEMLPQLTQNLSGIFKDARISFSGNDNPLQGSLMSSIDLVFDRIKDVYRKGNGAPGEKP
ncbi:MAG: SPFH domain-containing protein [Candidatus Eremiobacteraeota bacterium]|nr:SPFH domain-containing protein [Candidatus Eremiobacteraeota bacterium]